MKIRNTVLMFCGPKGRKVNRRNKITLKEGGGRKREASRAAN